MVARLDVVWSVAKLFFISFSKEREKQWMEIFENGNALVLASRVGGGTP